MTTPVKRSRAAEKTLKNRGAKLDPKPVKVLTRATRLANYNAATNKLRAKRKATKKLIKKNNKNGK